MTAVPLDDAGLSAPAAPRRRALPRRAYIAVGLAAVAAIAGVAWILAAKPTASTDDAYVQADKTSVAPKVRGLVAEVLVRDNQVVKAGDPLIRLDGEEYAARLASAEADVANAHAAVDAARAAITSNAAEVRLATSNIAMSQTAISAADAQAARADADRTRFERLLAAGTIARRDADNASAAAASADAEAARSRAALEVARNQAALTVSHGGGLSAALEQAQAAEAKARAALNLARQDTDNGLIRAPIDGIVAARQAQPGDYVQPGTRLMTLVPNTDLYVSANFKETQTSRMRVGDAADVRVDALPGVTLHGRIESLAPGSGSDFALLPFEPGAGNFTKIVQRVAVRIRLDPGQPALPRLRSGLSATVKVSLGGRD